MKVLLILLISLCMFGCDKKNEIEPEYFIRQTIHKDQTYVSHEILNYPELLNKDGYFNVVENKEICGVWRALNFRDKDDIKYDINGEIITFYPSGFVFKSAASSSGTFFNLDTYTCDENFIIYGEGVGIYEPDQIVRYRYELSQDNKILTIYSDNDAKVIIYILEKLD